MKKIILMSMCLFSLASQASYHFECYQVLGSRVADHKFLLIPNTDKLESGAIFASENEQVEAVHFTFANKNKRKVKLQAEDGSQLIIKSQGNTRKMLIIDQAERSVEYQCMIESSI